MTKIYFIRHAEAEGNLYRIAHGHTDGLITDRGLLQIRALSERFRDIPVDAVYSSDLTRACTTAEAIYMPQNQPLHKDARLREVYMGVWEGMTWRDISTEYDEQMQYFSKNMEKWVVPGAETAWQVRDRMLAALHDMARMHPNRTIAVFSHGAAMRIALGALQGLSMEDSCKIVHGDNTAVSLLEADGDSIRVVYRDDNAHMIAAGLSAFGKMGWWKSERASEDGPCYRPFAPERDTDFYLTCRREAGLPLERVPKSHVIISVRYQDQTIGIVELAPDKEQNAGAGWIDFYYLAPAWRGRHFGIGPLGQAVQYYRSQGRDCLRLICANAQVRTFFLKYGFKINGDSDGGPVLEKSIRYRSAISR